MATGETNTTPLLRKFILVKWHAQHSSLGRKHCLATWLLMKQTVQWCIVQQNSCWLKRANRFKLCHGTGVCSGLLRCVGQVSHVYGYNLKTPSFNIAYKFSVTLYTYLPRTPPQEPRSVSSFPSNKPCITILTKTVSFCESRYFSRSHTMWGTDKTIQVSKARRDGGVRWGSLPLKGNCAALFSRSRVHMYIKTFRDCRAYMKASSVEQTCLNVEMYAV